MDGVENSSRGQRELYNAMTDASQRAWKKEDSSHADMDDWMRSKVKGPVSTCYKGKS